MSYHHKESERAEELTPDKLLERADAADINYRCGSNEPVEQGLFSLEAALLRCTAAIVEALNGLRRGTPTK